MTLFAGLRVWDGLEAYVNPEVDQGFGLSNTLGVAGFPSGEAYKIGMTDPYLRLPRAFFRYTLFLLVSFVSVCSRFWYSSFCS